MAEFVCNRCGKCCASLGRHIRIERQLNERDYYCRNNLDRTVFPVCVDAEYREEIAEDYENRSVPGDAPCIFLRKNRSGEGSVCAVYASRPNVCREFRCYRILIRDPDGTLRGKVVGKHTLRTEDRVLEGLWTRYLEQVPFRDTREWSEGILRMLGEHGYRAETAD